MKFGNNTKAANGTEVQPSTVGGTIAKMRRESMERYRTAVRDVAESDKPTKPQLLALGEAAHELGLAPAEADADVSALRSLAVARRAVANMQAQEPEWAKEAREARAEIDRVQHKELPRLRGVIADRQAKMSGISDHMRVVSDIESAAVRLFGPADLSLEEMRAREAKVREQQRRQA